MNNYCFQCGECCKGRVFNGLVLTKIEFEIISKSVLLDVQPFDESRVQIVTKESCPHCVNDKCTIHSIRPTMCRMHHCGKLTPFDSIDSTNTTVINLIKTNRDYRRYKIKIEQDAIQWGNKHGWNFFKAKFITLTGFASE